MGVRLRQTVVVKAPFLIAAFILQLSGVSLPAAILFQSGFEHGSVRSPVGWSFDDAGMSMVSGERVRGGERSLRISDNSPDKLGSSAWSDEIPVQPGQRVRVSAWCFVERSNMAEPLGLYVEFRDRAGRRLEDPWGQRTPLDRGRWNFMVASRIAPTGAAGARVWFHSFNAATMTGHVDEVTVEVVDGAQPVDVAGWSGARLDPEVRKEWPAGIRWRHGVAPAVDNVFQFPRDLSAFKALEFNLHSERATGSTFVLILASENAATEGPDYYSSKLTVDFQEWKTVSIPLREMRASRQPAGWNSILSLKLRANGYDQTVNPATELVFDGVKFVR